MSSRLHLVFATGLLSIFSLTTAVPAGLAQTTTDAVPVTSDAQTTSPQNRDQETLPAPERNSDSSMPRPDFQPPRNEEMRPPHSDESRSDFQPPRNEETRNGDVRPPQQDEAARERMEEQRKKMEVRQLQEMKRGLKRMSQELKRFRQMVDRFSKKKISLSTECSELLSKAEAALKTAEQASSMEAMQEAGMEDMGDIFPELHECIGNMERRSRIPAMLKRVDRDITRMEREWQRAKKSAPADAADIVADGEGVIKALKDARAKVAAQLTSGDVEDIQDILDEEVFGRFDDLGAVMQRLMAAKNAKRFMAEHRKHLQAAERLIISLKKRGENTSELEEILKRAKAQVERIKTLKAGTEEFEDAVEELAEIGQEFAEHAEAADSAERMLQAPTDRRENQRFDQFMKVNVKPLQKQFVKAF